ncbi:MAG: hypothetical protein ACOY90_01775 [Candidatus Zhuqueibacterota bacterium]
MRRLNDRTSIEQRLDFEPLAKKSYTIKRKFRRVTKVEKVAIPNLLANSLSLNDGNGHPEHTWEELRVSLRQTLLRVSQLRNAGYEAVLIADRMQLNDDDWQLLKMLTARPGRSPATKKDDGKADNRFEFAE